MFSFVCTMYIMIVYLDTTEMDFILKLIWEWNWPVCPEMNSLRPGDQYMHQETGSLVQGMACGMFNVKPSTELMITYIQINP